LRSVVVSSPFIHLSHPVCHVMNFSIRIFHAFDLGFPLYIISVRLVFIC
jgi:hypothetical protein